MYELKIKPKSGNFHIVAVAAAAPFPLAGIRAARPRPSLRRRVAQPRGGFPQHSQTT